MVPFATFGEVLSTGALVVSLSTFAFTLINKRRERWKETQDEWDAKFTSIRHNQEIVINKISGNEKDIEVLKKQFEVFWKGVSYSSSQALHSPHTPELDKLIEKFQQETISSVELAEFKNKLRAIINDTSESLGRQKSARETLLTIYLQYDLQQIILGSSDIYYDIKGLFGDVKKVMEIDSKLSEERPQ